MKNIYLILILMTIFGCDNNKKEKKVTKKPEKRIEAKSEINSKNENLSKNYNVALKFINDYIYYSNNSDEEEVENGIIKWVNSNQNVSQEFKNELTKMINEANENDPEIGLGFDPILDTQDFSHNGFKLSEFDGNSNYLSVESKNLKDFKVRMKIKKINNKWLVDGCGAVNIPEVERIKR